MKVMGLQPEDPTYTALFNACANSPFKEKALRNARHLRELMAEKDYQPNSLVYRAMMKAFGMCGDIQTAFGIVDEMIENKIPVDDHCFKHLLITCISDKEAGFKHAIEVWRKMRKKRITPDGNAYNLLLRAVRDCGAGDPEFANELISKPQTHLTSGLSSSPVNAPSHSANGPPWISSIDDVSQNLMIDNEKHHGQVGSLTQLSPTSVEANSGEESKWWTFENSLHDTKLLTSKDQKEDEETSSFSGMSVTEKKALNILNPRIKFKEIISLGNLGDAENRLLLLGGAPGVLSHMMRDNAVPDIRTFTLLLDCISPNCTMEEDLLETMLTHQVKPDVDFLSLLIRKRNLRYDLPGAKDILLLMNKYGLVPNMRTFVCLAMGCRRKQDGLQLLTDIDNMGMLPSVEVFNVLIQKSHTNFDYKLTLCKQMRELEVRPDKITLHCIETQIAKARRNIVDMEKGKQVPKAYQSIYYSKKFGNFMMYYKEWLLSMEVDLPCHPWDQFRTPVQDKIEQ